MMFMRTRLEQESKKEEYSDFMRAILEVLEGPLMGLRIEVHSGRNITIGRTINADIAVSGDCYMSARHFALENTGDTLFVRDLYSSNGTFVNGLRVYWAPAAAQDVIVAGSSKFRLHLEEEDLHVPGNQKVKVQTSTL